MINVKQGGQESKESTDRSTTKHQRLSWWSKERNVLAVWPVMLLMIVVGSFIQPRFLSIDNALNVIQQASVLAVLTLALLLVLICGKFDISLESTVGFAPMLAAHLIVPRPYGFGTEIDPLLGVIVALVLGGIIGFINGYLVVRLGLNDFITTLAALILLRGLTLGVSSGRTVFSPPATFTFLGMARVWGIPLSSIIAGLLFIVVWIFLEYHRIGRNLYAIGNNPSASRAAGIPVERTIHSMYVVAGVMAGLAGLMLSGRIDSVVVSQGQGEIFNVFAALAIGAISLFGGKGTVFGAFTGVMFLSILANLLVLSQVPSFWVDASRGVIIIAALVLQRYTSGNRSRA